MAHRGGPGPAGNIGVWDIDAIVQFVGERAEAAAQYDADGRLRSCVSLNVTSRFGDHSSIPAIQADMKFAIDPAATARSPKRARSDLRLGASAPMPPI